MVMAKLRIATFEDADAIHRLGLRNGFGPLDIPAWRARWEAYPFAAELKDFPIGWVLEADGGEVVGSFGNVPLVYELRGRRLVVAIAAEWAVDASYRNISIRLLTAFLKQPGADICVNGSANLSASKVMAGMKTPAIPEPDYAAPMFWAANPVAFARAVLRRRKLRAADFLAWPAGAALGAWDIARGSGRGRTTVPVERLGAFDRRFDGLWERLAKGPERLRAVRTAAVLDWRFGSALRENSAVLLVAGPAAQPAGYAVLLRRPNAEQGFGLYDVADLQAVGDDPATVRSLLIHAVRAARKDGVDAVKFLTGHACKRLPALELRPYSYRIDYNQLFYRAAAPDLAAELTRPEVWDFAPFETY
jgi:hypothetical protein